MKELKDEKDVVVVVEDMIEDVIVVEKGSIDGEVVEEDIIVENIKLINITYLNRVDVNNTKIIKGIIKSLDKKITDKIILKVSLIMH